MHLIRSLSARWSGTPLSCTVGSQTTMRPHTQDRLPYRHICSNLGADSTNLPPSEVSSWATTCLQTRGELLFLLMSLDSWASTSSSPSSTAGSRAAMCLQTQGGLVYLHVSLDPGAGYIDCALLQGRVLRCHVSSNPGRALVPPHVPETRGQLLHCCPHVGRAPEPTCASGLGAGSLIIMHSDNACSCTMELGTCIYSCSW
jgi:hypothetical protein